jgi:16S rRNA (cytosine967-C5)-methyltransferase
MGIAGALELEHFEPGVLINALVQGVKESGCGNDADGESRLVNAVLRAVMSKAPAYIERLSASSAMRDQALVLGIPGWVAAEWSREWGAKEARRLLRLSATPARMAVRLSPGIDRESWIRDCADLGARPSEISKFAVLIDATLYPANLKGYAGGASTPQSESSIWAVENMLAVWQGGRLLDMCVGRGIKAGHILSYCEDATVEGWDISSERLGAAASEFERLGVKSRAFLSRGDASVMSPSLPPSAIILDVPCSGSGTWGRHPEGKWRMTPEKLEKMSELQTSLFARAVDIAPPGGVIMYSTCSIFREENEKVVGSVLASRSDLVELPIRAKSACQRKGRPYGAIMFPESPWLDGFYIAIFKKKR